MKIAGYARTSTRKQDLEGQRRVLQEWAQKNRHALTIFEDDHTSGRKTKRSGIDALLAAVERGEVQSVVLTELSRIGRSMSFVHEVCEKVSAKGGKIVLAQTGSSIDPKTLEGKALLGALALAAEIEWHLIQERNARGRATIKARGVRVGRKKRDVSPVVLKALREKGLSVRKIAKEIGVSSATIQRRLKALGKP